MTMLSLWLLDLELVFCCSVNFKKLFKLFFFSSQIFCQRYFLLHWFSLHTATEWLIQKTDSYNLFSFHLNLGCLFNRKTILLDNARDIHLEAKFTDRKLLQNSNKICFLMIYVYFEKASYNNKPKRKKQLDILFLLHFKWNCLA